MVLKVYSQKERTENTTVQEEYEKSLQEMKLMLMKLHLAYQALPSETREVMDK